MQALADMNFAAAKRLGNLNGCVQAYIMSADVTPLYILGA
jgi:hypothetical protein